MQSNLQPDYLIVGSGLTGATIARRLKEAGYSVLILERRNHVGGNVHDHTHPSGIRIHTYGPHYFRTSSERIWEYVTSFSDFYNYEASLQSLVDGSYERWPISSEYIQRAVGTSWTPDFTGEPKNFEEASLAMMPRKVYEKFVKGYSEKQWGVNATELSAGLAGRFDVRHDNETRLKRSKHQGIPRNGYASFMTSMLTNMPVILNCDYLATRDAWKPKHLTIFTGPIDEYFQCSLGKLQYRGQHREHFYHPDADYIQPCGQVNNPDALAGPHIRTLEWKHMLEPAYATRIRGSVLTTETTISPTSPTDYEYPMPDATNSARYSRYKEMAATVPGLLICGRLGEYRYFDMDQAIARAMMIADRIITLARAEALRVDLNASANAVRTLNQQLLSEEEPIALEA